MTDIISRKIYYIRPTDCPKLFYSWGNLFNVEGYGFDGIAMLRTHAGMILSANSGTFERNMPKQCRAYIHCLRQEPLHISQVDELVFKVLDDLANRGCKRIGFHGVETLSNDYESEKVTIQSVKKWIELNDHKVESIILVDALRSYEEHFQERSEDYYRWFTTTRTYELIPLRKFAYESGLCRPKSDPFHNNLNYSIQVHTGK